MMKRAWIVVALAGIAGCSGRPVADMERLRQVHQQWAQAINNGDMDGITARLARDSSLFPPNAPPVLGRDATRAWFETVTAQLAHLTFLESRLEMDEVFVEGNWGYTRSTMHVTLQPSAGGEPFSDGTKALVIWRRDPDGEWRMVRDMWNSNLPPPGPPGESE